MPSPSRWRSNLLDKGIRVNAVAPGPVWTPLNPADRPAEEVKDFGKHTDMKRPAQPEELSPAYVFLAAPCCASYITGIVLPITGSVGASERRKERPMAAYGKKAAEKVERAMHERKKGTLRSGKSGKKVTSRKQAIAIGLSEARRAGGKVPRKRAS